MTDQTPAPAYQTDLPSEEEIGEQLTIAIKTWENRNNFIKKGRAFLDGKNQIMLPAARTYKTVARRTYKLLSYQNQVLSRLGHLPRIAAIASGASDDAQRIAQEIERWTNEAIVELSRRSGRVWTRAMGDAAMFGEGIIEIVRAPGAFWPEIVPVDVVDEETGEPVMDDETGEPQTIEPLAQKFTRMGEELPKNYEALRMEYKRAAGLNQRWRYVPLETYFPIKEGDVTVATFELEQRWLREILNNKNFDTSRLHDAMGSEERKRRIGERVTVLRYVNGKHYAYYALGTRDGTISFPDMDAWVSAQGGMPILLQDTIHGVGRPTYASIPGRYGGWIDDSNHAEKVTGAMMEQNQYLDELASQGFTNVRVRYWPTTVTTYNREARGFKPGARPKPINVNEGGDIALFTDEKISILFDAYDDPTFRFLWEKTEQDMGMLGGAPALFGRQEPGVETGYQEQLKISQSESLYEMTEEGATIGAVNVARLILDHVRVSGEKTPVQVTGKRDDGRPYTTYLELDPADLDPIPKLDAQVTRPKPVDWIAMIRAALDITTPYGVDQTPLMSKKWARENLLSIEDPTSEAREIRIEAMEAQAVAANVLTEMVLVSLKLMETRAGTEGAVSPDMAAEADPTLLGTIQNLGATGPAAQDGSGGLSPEVINSVDQASNGRRVGGTPAGTAQPEASMGKQVASVAASGRVPVP